MLDEMFAPALAEKRGRDEDELLAKELIPDTYIANLKAKTGARVRRAVVSTKNHAVLVVEITQADSGWRAQIHLRYEQTGRGAPVKKLEGFGWVPAPATPFPSNHEALLALIADVAATIPQAA